MNSWFIFEQEYSKLNETWTCSVGEKLSQDNLTCPKSLSLSASLNIFGHHMFEHQITQYKKIWDSISAAAGSILIFISSHE